MAYPVFFRPTSGLFALLCAGTLATGCSGRSRELDTGDATEGEPADASGGSEGEGGSNPADGAAEGPGESGAAEGGSEGGAVDEGGSEGGTDPGTDPAECDAGDGISASFSVDDHDWPEAEEFEIDVDVECEIVDMGGFDGEVIAPTLECDVDGTLRSVTITMTDPGFTTPDEHPLLPAFDVGQPVRFRHWGVQDAGGIVDGIDPQASHYLLEAFSLHRVDGALLAAGFDSWGMDDELHAPVVVSEDDTFCGESLPFPDDPERPMLMTFTVEGASLSLVGGHAGFLDLSGGFGDDGLGIVAEVAQAGGCCHTNRSYRVLMIALHQGEG